MADVVPHVLVDVVEVALAIVVASVMEHALAAVVMAVQAVALVVLYSEYIDS